VGSVVLQDNGGDNLALSANGSFVFSASIPLGQSYSVTVLSQPTGPDCAVSNASGTVVANISSVAVVCTVDPKNFYVPVAAYAPPGTNSSATAGLYVIPSKDVSVAPVAIMAGNTAPVAHWLQFAVNAEGQLSGGRPTSLVFATQGAPSGDHWYALDLTGSSQLLPSQISSLTVPGECPSKGVCDGQIIGVMEAYENLADPHSAFLIFSTFSNLGACYGTTDIVHLTDTPTTPPIKLSPKGPILVTSTLGFVGTTYIYDASKGLIVPVTIPNAAALIAPF
jgi:hypothetical protein